MTQPKADATGSETALVIRGGLLLTMNPRFEVLGADLVIRNGRIQEIGPARPEPGASVIDASGMLVLPGFIQTHVHLVQTLFRGVADSVPLLTWLERFIWPLEVAHDAESVRAATRLAAAELLKSGTTAVLTMETVYHTEVVFETLAKTPLYATVGKCLMDTGDRVPRDLLETPEVAMRNALALVDRFDGSADGRLRCALAPRFALSCTEALHHDVAAVASARGLPVHTHAAEHPTEVELIRARHGRGNLELLADFDLVKGGLKVAHCVHLNERERAMARERQISVLHCPSSNLKLGSGIAPIGDYLDRGVRVSLGADGAACNNRLDMLEELRLAALLQRAIRGPDALPPREALALATIAGARALEREAEMGSLEVGKIANVILIDTQASHLVPSEDPYATVVFAARASDIKYTIAGGRVVMKHGELLVLDEDEVCETARRERRRLLERAGLS